MSWHNSVGIVALLELQVFSFNFVRILYADVESRRAILLVTMFVDEVVGADCTVASHIAALKMKFEQTSWHRNSKLVGRFCRSLFQDVVSVQRYCHLFRTFCVRVASKTWRKLNEPNNLHSYSFARRLRPKWVFLFTLVKFESNRSAFSHFPWHKILFFNVLMPAKSDRMMKFKTAAATHLRMLIGFSTERSIQLHPTFSQNDVSSECDFRLHYAGIPWNANPMM